MEQQGIAFKKEMVQNLVGWIMALKALTEPGQ
jgi:hypothetical protein